MTGIETWMRRARWQLALLGGMTGLLFAAAPAQAQDVCGDLGDVSENMLEIFIDDLADEFEVGLDDEALCAKLAKNFVKACQTTVKDVVKCIDRAIVNLNKQAKAACKGLAGDETSACIRNFKERAKEDSQGVESIAADEAEDCLQDEAEEFFDICMFGF